MTTRAVTVRHTGGSEVLVLESRPDAPLGPGRVRVDVTACGVNYIDVYQRSGRYPAPLPFVPGIEGAGVVAELGEGVTGVRPGDRVAWVQTPGGYADRIVLDADRLLPVPEELSLEAAAAVALQGMTAHYLVQDSYRIRAGDTVLVHAAAGGVGSLLVQLAVRRGARVIGTVSSPEKERLALEAGAAHVVRYDREDFAERTRALTGGAGVDAVYDGVGASTFDAGLSVLRPRGTMVLFGQASGAVPPLDPQVLNAGGSLFLTRPSLTHHIASRAELLARAGDVFEWLAAGEIRVRVGGSYPLERAGRAHDELERRRTAGKLLLVP